MPILADIVQNKYPVSVSKLTELILLQRKCSLGASVQTARRGCVHYVWWPYQVLPPAEPQPSSPSLPFNCTPKTWAFISRAKFPSFLQSPSFLALRQSNNYPFSFPLLPASRKVFWRALVCMKYYQNIAHFSILQPLTRKIWSCRSCDWHMSVFHVPRRIAALFWRYSKNFWWKEKWCNVHKSFVALFNLRLPLFSALWRASSLPPVYPLYFQNLKPCANVFLWNITSFLIE